MSLSPEYRAVANFFRNTQNISRDDLKIILKEVVKDAVNEEVRRFMQTRDFRNIFETSIKRGMYDIRTDISSLVLDELLKRTK